MMRRSPQPVLMPPPFCGWCPLGAMCSEHFTDAACDHAGTARFRVHPGYPVVFEQFHNMGPSPGRPARTVALPTLPPYVTMLPREATVDAVRSLRGSAVAFSVHDYLALLRKATRARDRSGLADPEGQLLLVLGADPDRHAIRDWQDWPDVRDAITAERPTLVVGPDLGFYDHDQPASRLLFFNAHTRMYCDIVERGIAALVPVGWTLPSDLERLTLWVRKFRVPGGFLDLQNRTRDASFGRVLEDLRRYRDRLPDDFVWLVNGVQKRGRMAELVDVLGRVCFTSSQPWHLARRGRLFIFTDEIENVSTELPIVDALRESVRALTAAATAAAGDARPPLRIRRIRDESRDRPIRARAD